MDATKKEQMIAEAKFLRAYSYFQLVKQNNFQLLLYYASQ